MGVEKRLGPTESGRAGCHLFALKENRWNAQFRIICAATVGGPQENMKKINLSILCLFVLSWSALAQGDNSSPAADNSGRNQRDRSGETQTSGDQSNSSEDIKVTAAIRRAIVHDSSLSTMAKNVKIICESGVVTLRGPVKNEAEKAKVAELAKTHANNARVEDQLEVKASQ
jgi:hypothetical protein